MNWPLYLGLAVLVYVARPWDAEDPDLIQTLLHTATDLFSLVGAALLLDAGIRQAVHG